MAIEKTVEGADTTVTFSYTANTDRVIGTLTDAAHYLWDHGFGDHGTEEESIVFDDLTQGEMGSIVDTYVKKVLIDAAETYNSVEAQKVAREAADEEDKYI